jgi:hypothetical protein
MSPPDDGERSSSKLLSSLDAPLSDGLTNSLDVPSNGCIGAMAQPVSELDAQENLRGIHEGASNSQANDLRPQPQRW